MEVFQAREDLLEDPGPAPSTMPVGKAICILEMFADNSLAV